ncbi:MAG: DUF374 domain-containing protein [Acetobacter sp.]|nr:DUF374 domain-containing protein [Acetobacter sp.]
MNLKRTIKHFIRYIGRLPVVLYLIGTMAGVYVWLVGKTGRFDVQGIREFEEMIAKHNGGIFVTWHGRALMLPYFWHNPRMMKALVSPHADGRIIARLLKMFRIFSIDGSSDRQARAAALDIVKELNAGTVVSLISDGPTGPSMRLKKSVIYFAQKTGKPVMGFTYSSKGARVLRRNWDDMLVPRLFADGLVRGTKPLFVPADADEVEMERLRLAFEDELNQLTIEADAACGIVPPIVPKERRKAKKEKKK